MGCQICGCLFIHNREDNLNQCLKCYWIEDLSLKSDDEISLLNNYSINQYKKIVEKYPLIDKLDDEHFLVSTVDPDNIPLAFHHDLHGCQGCYGVVDKNWEVIIEPKFLFPMEKYGDKFLVCKGKMWHQSEKWDNYPTQLEHNKGKYWTEKENWGIIDINEKEYIPCMYDELECLNISWDDDDNISGDIFVARTIIDELKYKQTSKVLDINNNQLILDELTDVDYAIEDNQLVVFKGIDKRGFYVDENYFSGVYDFELKKMIIEPNKYKNIEIITRNLFIISDDPENLSYGTIINNEEKVIGEEKTWRLVFNIDNCLFKGETMDGKYYIFKIIGDQIVDKKELTKKEYSNY